MDTPDVLSKVGERLEALSRDDAALAAQEEGVRRKRADLQQEMAKLQAFVEVYRSLTGERVELPSGIPAQATAAQPPSESISNLAARYLEQQPGGQAKMAEIVAWLVSIGKLPSERSHNNYSVVYATLTRDKRFRRSKAGEFALVPAGPTIFGAPFVGRGSRAKE